MSNRWKMLQKRIEFEAKETLRNNVTDGTAIITVHILTQHDGEPLMWVVQDGHRIEPSKDASSIISALLGNLSS